MPQALKLLVMEDDLTFLRVICAYLEQRGHHPIPCSVVAHFLRLAAEGKPDVILLDAHLSDAADGLRLCSTLKRDRKTRDIPVLMMSGIVSGEYISRAISSGAASFLQKPFALKELERHIEDAVSHSSTQVAAGPRILWVEDDEEYRQLGLMAFRRAAFQVTCAGSLKDARRLMESVTPDMFLLDASLPDGSGLEFCEQIRGDRRFASATIVVLTGQRRLWDADGWYAAGADQCWFKTSNGDRLVASVKGLWRRQLTAQNPRPPVPGLSLDAPSRVIVFNGYRSRPLSPRELDLFDLLWSSHPDVVSREAIRSQVTGLTEVANSEVALNMFVKRLREKLPPKLAASVEAVRGHGYRLLLPS